MTGLSGRGTGPLNPQGESDAPFISPRKRKPALAHFPTKLKPSQSAQILKSPTRFNLVALVGNWLFIKLHKGSLRGERDIPVPAKARRQAHIAVGGWEHIISFMDFWPARIDRRNEPPYGTAAPSEPTAFQVSLGAHPARAAN